MDLSLSEDQQAVVELFGSLLEKECPPECVRAAEPLGFDPRLWDQICAAGAPGMALPEEVGGGGMGLLELALVCEEAGRRLAPVPLVEHSAAARLLTRLAPDHPRMADLAAGEAIAALGLHPAREGRLRLVPAGAVAKLVLGLDGDELVAAEADPPGETPANLAASPLADRELRAQTRQVLANGPEAREAFDDALGEWRALTAAALVGLAQAAFELGLAYVKEREQFDRKIGSFQAVQHGMVDAFVPLDGARLLARKAAWANDAGRAGASRLAAMALLFCGETAQRAAARSLHYHGGYGFSSEYDIQLYFRRAKGWLLALNDPSAEYQRLADRLFGPARAPGSD